MPKNSDELLTQHGRLSLCLRLGVSFETVLGESFFNDKMEPIVARALATGVAETLAACITLLAALRLPLLAAVAIGVLSVVLLRLLLA